MNALDRFVRYLVEVLQARAPGSVCHPMAIDDLRRTVLPYRVHRNALALESVEDYETLVLRMASEEGDYVRTFPPEAAERFRAEAASPHPDLELLDELGEATVAVWEAALPRILALEDEAIPPEAPAELPMVYEPDEHPAEPPNPLPAPAEEPPGGRRSVPAAVEPGASPPEQATARRARCLFCAAPLPAGRSVIFCPFCGQQLAATRCPGCETELEPGWRHCITCGHPIGPHRTDA